MEIAELVENFEGGSAGAALSVLNSFLDTVSNPTTPLIFSTDAIEGSFSMTLGTQSSPCVNYLNFPDISEAWFSFYFKVTSLPTSTATFINFFNDGDTLKIGDLRLSNVGALTLRSISTTVFTSSPLIVGDWYRVAIHVKVSGSGAGVIGLKLYTGADLNGITPIQDSGDKVLSVVATTFNTIKLGAINSDATMQYRLDRFRADTTVEPSGIVIVQPSPNWNQGKEVLIG